MRGRPFEPGKSGNPNGRPKVAEEFRARARRAVDEHVIEKWVAEVEAQGDEWVKCSELLAAYGYGKPNQTVDLSGDLGAPSPLLHLTIEELRAIARSRLAQESLPDGQTVK